MAMHPCSSKRHIIDTNIIDYFDGPRVHLYGACTVRRPGREGRVGRQHPSAGAGDRPDGGGWTGAWRERETAGKNNAHAASVSNTILSSRIALELIGCRAWCWRRCLLMKYTHWQRGPHTLWPLQQGSGGCGVYTCRLIDVAADSTSSPLCTTLTHADIDDRLVARRCPTTAGGRPVWCRFRSLLRQTSRWIRSRLESHGLQTITSALFIIASHWLRRHLCMVSSANE